MEWFNRKADAVFLCERQDRGDAIGNLLSGFRKGLSRNGTTDENNHGGSQCRRFADRETVFRDCLGESLGCFCREKSAAAEGGDLEIPLAELVTDSFNLPAAAYLSIASSIDHGLVVIVWMQSLEKSEGELIEK